MGQYLITEFANAIGYTIEQLLQFFANMIGGWIIFLAIMMVGFIIVIYFRFFKRRILAKETYENMGRDEKYL